MDENIKARYIDPMVDWSFKRLFGSAAGQGFQQALRCR